MAIFSRRTIQRLITENADFLCIGHTKNHVNKLNEANSNNFLEWEWEIVLLNAFSKLGKVIHEKNFGGPRNLDLYFEDLDDPNRKFLADIKTYCDKGYEEKYDVEGFRKLIYKLAKSKNVPLGAFHFNIGHVQQSRLTSKIKIPFPHPQELEEVLDEAGIDEFFRLIVENPAKQSDFIVYGSHASLASGDTRITSRIISLKQRDLPNFSIRYTPGEQVSTTTHPAFKYVQTLDKNTFRDRLNDKNDQLLNSGFSGVKGLLLCDGDCEMLRKTSSAWNQRSAGDVIRHFLRESSEIGFVVTFTIQRHHESGKHYQINFRFYKGNITDDYANWLENLLKKLHNVFPIPRNDAANARNLLKSKSPRSGSFYGAFNVRDMNGGIEVKISARALLDLLTGRSKQEDFFQLHGFDNPFIGNPFKDSIEKGAMIQEIAISKEDEDDDDWIRIRLNGPDAAISPFNEPPKK